MKALVALLLMLTVTSAYAVSFVIPEINTKFDQVDASISAIEALANGKILVGNGSGAAAEVTPSGDVTMSNAGVMAIASDVIVNADINSSAAIAYSKLNLSGAVLESDLTAASADGLHPKRVARATWDFAVDGGDVSAIDLGVTIPANALINFAYFYVVTQVTDGGAGTGALHCEDADNLYAAADVTGNAAGAVVLGIPQNGAANMVKNIASACNLTWTIAGAAATAGKLIFFVEYTVVE